MIPDFREASSLRFQSSFSRACILRKSWRVFHDRLLGDACCRGFVLPVFVVRFCSVHVHAHGIRLPTHMIKLLNSVYSHWCQFLNWGCV